MGARQVSLAVVVVAVLVVAGCSSPLSGPETSSPTVSADRSPTPPPTATPAPEEGPAPGVTENGTVTDVDALMAANEAYLRSHPYELSFESDAREGNRSVSLRIHVVEGADERSLVVEQGDFVDRKWERGHESAVTSSETNRSLYENSGLETGSGSLSFEEYHRPRFIRDYLEMGRFSLAGTGADGGDRVVELSADSVDPSYGGEPPSDLSITARVTPEGLITYFEVESTTGNRTVHLTHRVETPPKAAPRPAWVDRNISRLNATVGPEGRYLRIEHLGGPTVERPDLLIYSNGEFKRMSAAIERVGNWSTFEPGETLYVVFHQRTNRPDPARFAIGSEPEPTEGGKLVDPREYAVYMQTGDQRLLVAVPTGNESE